jgi:dTDP-4-dehydrorhamnose 3,5-epimerase
MRYFATAIEGMLIAAPERHVDSRGWVCELLRVDALQLEQPKPMDKHEESASHGCSSISMIELVQQNLSFSKCGVLRGLHVQRPPTKQGKLITLISGKIWDVVVDVRPGSPTYGSWVHTDMSDTAHNQVWVPPGCAHGFFAIDDSVVLYGLTSYWNKSNECVIRWDDSSLNIAWPAMASTPVLSCKDSSGLSVQEYEAECESHYKSTT